MAKSQSVMSCTRGHFPRSAAISRRFSGRTSPSDPLLVLVCSLCWVAFISSVTSVYFLFVPYPISSDERLFAAFFCLSCSRALTMLGYDSSHSS